MVRLGLCNTYLRSLGSDQDLFGYRILILRLQKAENRLEATAQGCGLCHVADAGSPLTVATKPSGRPASSHVTATPGGRGSYIELTSFSRVDNSLSLLEAISSCAPLTA